MLTLIVRINDCEVMAEFHNLQPYRVTPNTADFRDAGDRDTLAKLGIFSIDRCGHRCKRAIEARREQQIADAYVTTCLDRAWVYRFIAKLVQRRGLVPDGCWPQSTAAYGTMRNEEDEAALRWAERIRASEQYHVEIAGDAVVAAAYSLGA